MVRVFSVNEHTFPGLMFDSTGMASNLGFTTPALAATAVDHYWVSSKEFDWVRSQSYGELHILLC